jgi:hypothetical protein
LALRGGQAEVVDENDLLKANVTGDPGVVALEADTVRGASIEGSL